MRLATFVLAVLLCAAVFAVPAESGAAISHAAGYRIWLADWESFQADLGSSQLHMLYYNLTWNQWSGMVLAGMGSGWKGDTSRTDIQGTVARSFSLDVISVRLGAGWHYIDFSFDNFPGFGGASERFGSGSATFQGPEASVSAYKVIADSGVAVHLTGTILPYVWWDYDEDEYSVDDNSGQTMGYSADIGASYIRKRAAFSAGYRMFILQKDEGEEERALSAVDEEIKGIYAQVGVSF